MTTTRNGNGKSQAPPAEPWAAEFATAMLASADAAEARRAAEAAAQASGASILERELALWWEAFRHEMTASAEGSSRPARGACRRFASWVAKKARHGFMGGTAEALLDLILRGGGPYSATRMVRPREALRTQQKPFHMTERVYHLAIPDGVFKVVAEEWHTHQARESLPLPQAE